MTRKKCLIIALSCFVIAAFACRACGDDFSVLAGANFNHGLGTVNIYPVAGFTSDVLVADEVMWRNEVLIGKSEKYQADGTSNGWSIKDRAIVSFGDDWTLGGGAMFGYQHTDAYSKTTINPALEFGRYLQDDQTQAKWFVRGIFPELLDKTHTRGFSGGMYGNYKRLAVFWDYSFLWYRQEAELRHGISINVMLGVKL